MVELPEKYREGYRELWPEEVMEASDVLIGHRAGGEVQSSPKTAGDMDEFFKEAETAYKPFVGRKVGRIHDDDQGSDRGVEWVVLRKFVPGPVVTRYTIAVERAKRG